MTQGRNRGQQDATAGPQDGEKATAEGLEDLGTPNKAMEWILSQLQIGGNSASACSAPKLKATHHGSNRDRAEDFVSMARADSEDLWASASLPPTMSLAYSKYKSRFSLQADLTFGRPPSLLNCTPRELLIAIHLPASLPDLRPVHRGTYDLTPFTFLQQQENCDLPL